MGTILALGTAPASALTFNFTQISGTTLTADERAAFETAAAAWSSALSDNITVNVAIGFASLGAGILGQTTPSLVYSSTANVINALANDATTATDAAAVASLQNLQPSNANIIMSSAEAKALGFTTTATTDGTIEFSTNFTFSTSRNADGSTDAGTYDLIGVAEHELGHLLGFDSMIDYSASTPSLLDEFRFSGYDTRSFSAGVSGTYFSLDDGLTSVKDPNGVAANFSPGGSGNYQASHWTTNVDGIMVPAYATGQTYDISQLDITALDAIGWDAIPEPGSLVLVLSAVFALAGVRRQAA